MDIDITKELAGKVALVTGGSSSNHNESNTMPTLFHLDVSAHAVISRSLVNSAQQLLLPIPRLSLDRAIHQCPEDSQMSTMTASDAAKAVVRRNTEEVQGGGNFGVFEELFADDFVDHTPQPNTTPDKAGVRKLYGYIRAAFPDFHAEIHWQRADGECVTTYKTYHGTHEGPLLGVAPTHRKIHFESVDVMRVRNGKITDHWGVGNLLSLMEQIGGWTPPADA